MAYNVKRAIEAHRRLGQKNRDIRRLTNDPSTYFSSLEKELYHSDCLYSLRTRGKKLSKSEKSEIFKNASHRARSK